MPGPSTPLPLGLILFLGILFLLATLSFFWSDLFPEPPAPLAGPDTDSVPLTATQPLTESTQIRSSPGSSGAEEPGYTALEDPLYPQQRSTLVATFLEATVQGRIINEMGEPVPDALIRLTPVLADYWQAIVPHGDYETAGKSTNMGRFLIRLPGESLSSLRVDKAGFAPYRADYVMPGDDLIIRLEKCATLAGIVTAKSSGQPLEGVKVLQAAPSTNQPQLTDKAGQFLLKDLPSGRIDLIVFHPEHDIKTVKALYLAETKENVVAIELKEGDKLSGIVIDQETGQPIHRAQVAYIIGHRDKEKREEGQALYEASRETDREGYFEYEQVSRKGFRLQVTAEGYCPLITRPGQLKNKDNGILTLSLHREAGLSGKVLGPDARPVNRALVKVRLPGLWEKEEKTCYSDQSGDFSLHPIAGGEITVHVYHPDFGPASEGPIRVHPGQRTEGIEITLPLSTSISGRVLTRESLPVAGARVTIDGMRTSLARVFQVYPVVCTDQEGCFRFDKLTEGTYQVAATHGTERCPVESISVEEGQEEQVILTLEECLTINGLVYDLRGEPLDDVLVTATAMDPAWADSRSTNLQKWLKKERKNKKDTVLSAPSINPATIEELLFRKRKLTHLRGNYRSQPDGRFLATGFLPEDEVALGFWKDGFKTKGLYGIFPSREDIYVQLEPICQVTGLVFDSVTFEPIPSFSVTLRKSTGHSGKQTSDPSKTLALWNKPQEQLFRSEEGTFAMDYLTEGFYELIVFTKGYQEHRTATFEVTSANLSPYLEIALDPTGSLSGRVEGTDQGPVVGITVYLRSRAAKQSGKKNNNKSNKALQANSSQKTHKIRTDRRGRFVFPDLHPGDYEILIGDVKKPIHSPKRVTISNTDKKVSAFILEDLGTQGVSFLMEEGLSREINLVLEGGPGKAYQEGKSDGLGFYRFLNIIPGQYKLTARGKGLLPLKKNLTIDEGKNNDIEFSMGHTKKK